MKQKLLFLFLLFFISTVNCQTINRVEVNGIILSKTNDVEAVTIFNKSSNRGTITDETGAFVIKVAENDLIEISALQFQSLTITVDESVIKSKQLKIQLIEQVNQLDAVTLSSGLTGNIETDIDNVKTVEPITLDMGNMNIDFEYNDDKAFDNSVILDHYTSITDPNARKYLPNIGAILGLIFNSKKSLKNKKDVFVGYKYEKPKDLLAIYSHKDLSEILNIPSENLEEFLSFVENNGIEPELLKPENQLLLFEFLFKQKDLFLKLKDGKK